MSKTPLARERQRLRRKNKHKQLYRSPQGSASQNELRDKVIQLSVLQRYLHRGVGLAALLPKEEEATA